MVSLAPWVLLDERYFLGELTRLSDLDGDVEILIGSGFGSTSPGSAQILAGGTFDVLAELVSPNGSVALGADNNNIFSEVDPAVGDFDGDGAANVLLAQKKDTNAAAEGSQLVLFSLDAAVLGRPETVGGMTVTVGPNPAREALRVTLQLARPTDATVEVFDLLGRQVSQHRLAVTTAPTPLDLDTAGWAPGPYLVHIKAGDARETRTVTVVR